MRARVAPLPIANGERVELVLVNQTGMPHPMHLHGHEFQVVEIDGKRFPGQCATLSWSRPADAWWWPSMPITRAYGPSTAICSTTSTPACLRRFATCSRRPGESAGRDADRRRINI
jgi:hypothetical protein